MMFLLVNYITNNLLLIVHAFGQRRISFAPCCEMLKSFSCFKFCSKNLLMPA